MVGIPPPQQRGVSLGWGVALPVPLIAKDQDNDSEHLRYDWQPAVQTLHCDNLIGEAAHKSRMSGHRYQSPSKMGFLCQIGEWVAHAKCKDNVGSKFSFRCGPLSHSTEQASA